MGATTTDTSSDDTSLSAVINRMTGTDSISTSRPYLKDDARQKTALEGRVDSSPQQEYGFQNYAFPTDLFRYCSSDCTLENALSDFFWNRDPS